MVSQFFSRAAAIAARIRVRTLRQGAGWRFATVFAAFVAAAGMTTMVANATRVAAVAEDAARLLGLRSPGERAADVIATKRRHAQLSPSSIGTPVRNQVLSNAVDPGAGVGAGSPLTALLDQPGFVAPALLGNSGPSGVGGGEDVAVADLPPPAFTPGGIVLVGGGVSAGGSSGGTSGGGGGATSSTGGATSTGGTGSTSTGGDATTSTGGTTTTTSTGGSSTTSTGGETTTSGGTTSSTGGSTTSGGIISTSTGGTTSSGGEPIEPNVPAVPEPSTWLMMLAGFAAIGTAMRRAARRSSAHGA